MVNQIGQLAHVRDLAKQPPSQSPFPLQSGETRVPAPEGNAVKDFYVAFASDLYA